MMVETHLDQTPDGKGTFWGTVAKGLFYLLGYAAVFGLVGLSMWAVAQVQLDSRPAGDPLRYWYLAAFLVAEAWVAIGLTIMILRFRESNWAAGMVALMCWIPAIGLSAMQESRFHLLLDSQQDAEVAPELTKRMNAEARIEEITTDLGIMVKPTRSVASIEAEYNRFKDRPKYPTKTAELLSELENAKSYTAMQSELATHRTTMEETAAVAAESQDAKKVGQSFTVPWLGWEVSSNFTVWTLIIWMMAIKSLGPWLLFGSSLKGRKAAQKDETVSMDELYEATVQEAVETPVEAEVEVIETPALPSPVQVQQEALEEALAEQPGELKEIRARDGTMRKMKVI